MSEISSLEVIDEESDSYSSEINIESEINSVSTPKKEKEEKLIISSEENKVDPENL